MNNQVLLLDRFPPTWTDVGSRVLVVQDLPEYLSYDEEDSSDEEDNATDLQPRFHILNFSQPGVHALL